ncbi:hypothetical protein QR680_000206 [Steinernema hermaphroditum]|uniref:Uncharacterized protein n=1 Tax=Steinernema hermaphroditum TaxID=289476 RepID=A0AA39GU03_9BILA|nr:hypothetical protein QR680_000206 [Steinernema hermaphroditum]
MGDEHRPQKSDPSDLLSDLLFNIAKDELTKGRQNEYVPTTRQRVAPQPEAPQPSASRVKDPEIVRQIVAARLAKIMGKDPNISSLFKATPRSSPMQVPQSRMSKVIDTETACDVKVSKLDTTVNEDRPRPKYSGSDILGALLFQTGASPTGKAGQKHSDTASMSDTGAQPPTKSAQQAQSSNDKAERSVDLLKADVLAAMASNSSQHDSDPSDLLVDLMFQEAIEARIQRTNCANRPPPKTEPEAPSKPPPLSPPLEENEERYDPRFVPAGIDPDREFMVAMNKPGGSGISSTKSQSSNPPLSKRTYQVQPQRSNEPPQRRPKLPASEDQQPPEARPDWFARMDEQLPDYLIPGKVKTRRYGKTLPSESKKLKNLTNLSQQRAKTATSSLTGVIEDEAALNHFLRLRPLRPNVLPQTTNSLRTGPKISIFVYWATSKNYPYSTECSINQQSAERKWAPLRLIVQARWIRTKRIKFHHQPENNQLSKTHSARTQKRPILRPALHRSPRPILPKFPVSNLYRKRCSTNLLNSSPPLSNPFNAKTLLHKFGHHTPLLNGQHRPFELHYLKLCQPLFLQLVTIPVTTRLETAEISLHHQNDDAVYTTIMRMMYQ